MLQKNYNILIWEFNFNCITYLVQTSLLKEDIVFHRTCKNSFGLVQVGVAVQKEKHFGNQIMNALRSRKQMITKFREWFINDKCLDMNLENYVLVRVSNFLKKGI